MPRHHLTLVWPHAFYRSPPDLSNPSLREAFDAGRAADGRDQRAEMERWMEFSKRGRSVRQAYLAGSREEIGAPMGLGRTLALISLGAVTVAATTNRTGAARRAVEAAAIAAEIPLALRRRPSAEAVVGSRQLTLETAPVPTVPASVWLHIGIAALHQLRSRLRHGRQPASLTAVVAASVTRTLMHRRSWHEAVRRT